MRVPATLLFLGAAAVALTLDLWIGDQPAPAGLRWRPTPGTSFQLQFAGDQIDITIPAEIYDVDLFEVDPAIIDELHTSGRRVICYVSVGTIEHWRPDADRFPSAVVGKSHATWPDENWLDIRQIDMLAPILGERLDLARAKGCDGVDPDNIDGYSTDSGFPLGEQSTVAFLHWLIAEAHARALSIGIKNAPELLDDLAADLDWVIVEDCHAQGWCGDVELAGKRGLAVFQIEYTDTGVDWDGVCSASTIRGFFAVLKNRELDAFRQTCE